MNYSSLFTDGQHIVSINHTNSEEVSVDVALEILPVNSTVVCAQYQTTRPDYVATQPVCERYAVEPLLQIAIHSRPIFTAVFRSQNGSVRTNSKTALLIKKVDVFQPTHRI